ncbi:MAG: phosphatase, partial [Peptostreptococcaceae bacterium]|nr:phosphatase [Peptostreptococcaceae bacterium]
GLRYNLKDVHPSREIISLYRELGGEIITIGSDSHVASTVGQDFDLAEKLLMDIGFKYYTVYDKMQPSFLKLG